MDFLKTYFTDPIYYNTGYNVVNTATYAILLVVAVFLVYKLLGKMKISVDRKFFTGIVPFIVLGGVLRAYEDLLEAIGATAHLPQLLEKFVMVDAFGIYRNLLLISPVIYIIMFFIALATLVISKLLERETKIEYWKIWLAIGAILNIFVLSQLRIISTFAIITVVFITSGWFIALFLAKKAAVKWKITKLSKLLTHENIFIIGAHMFEATATFVALQFPKELGVSYFEQHVVAGFLIGALGAWSFFLLKLAIVPLVLYYFDKEFEGKDKISKSDAEKKTFLKIIVLILGIGPGIRNFLRMVMGV